MKTRCPWVNLDNPLYVEYHDKEWGRPVHEDQKLFEMLILEGAQAGLSWETILKKRHHYQKVYLSFDPKKVARFSESKQQKLLQDPGIVRNRLKVAASVQNAKAFLQVQKEFGSFSKYLWAFADGKPILNNPKKLKDYPTKTTLSDTISKDLKKRGFKFVGSTIIYAYLQAIGIVNDHTIDCYCHPKSKQWSVYIIQCADGTLYTGVSTDVERRFEEHSSQGDKCAKYLKGKAPLKLVYTEVLPSKGDALKKEYQIKQLPRREKIRLID